MSQMIPKENQQEDYSHLISERFIDVEKVIRSKSEKLARRIPGFVYRYLRRIIHEKEINKALYENRHLIGLDFVREILKEFGAKIILSGKENIPAEGRYLAVSNHPLGGLDGMALMNALGEFRKDIVFPVNDLLMFLPNLRPLFIPINKHGRNDENLGLMTQTFESEKLILYFPAGLVSRKQKGVIKDLEWKKTFITLSVRFKRDIIPIFVDGKNSNFFYNLALWRKRLGIKANIEMLYLVDEMFKQKNKTIHIHVGKAIPWQTFTNGERGNVWAERIKEHVYKLSADYTLPFQPVPINTNI